MAELPGGNGRMRLFWVVLLAGLAGGCAAYGDWIHELEEDLAAGDYQGAMATLDEHGRGRRDAVLYLLNRGLLLRMTGEFAQSNAAFEEAKTLMERLSAVSVSEQAGALTVNDLMRSYAGEFHERVLLHLFAALNYLDLGQPREARVEILQLDELLEQLDSESLAGGAFARYFSGLVFDSLGEPDNALIAYRKAYQAYRTYPEDAALGVPRQLQQDLVRLTERLGLLEEARRLRREFGMETTALPEKGAGEVALILFSGLAPHKEESHVTVPTEDGVLVSVAMPYYEGRLPHVRGLRLEADGHRSEAERVEDINVLAMASLERRRPLILARALARAVLKHEAVEKAEKQSDGLGLLVNIVTVASERADTRSWSLLPSHIYLARLSLPEGEWHLRAWLEDDKGQVVGQRDYAVRIKAGQRLFLSMHWIDEEDLAWQADH